MAVLSIVLAGHLNAQQQTAPQITKFITDLDQPSGLLPYSLPGREELLLRIGQQIETTDLDCSHFVQWLFEQAGLYYGYAPSRTLYVGMPGFKRVYHPRPGDLIVWPGHVGVVVDPEEETFLSSLRSGVKTSSYTSKYWKRRGHPRFFRYLNSKNIPENRRQAEYELRTGRLTPGSE
ncbi:MAG TPA: NlpC/P60 family protein [Candidatus Sulfotelmatobacter sp.]|nr:NlpC/P60 family protein [Candidatus Sulfotelmatobacter sp.]